MIAFDVPRVGAHQNYPSPLVREGRCENLAALVLPPRHRAISAKSCMAAISARSGKGNLNRGCMLAANGPGEDSLVRRQYGIPAMKGPHLAVA